MGSQTKPLLFSSTCLIPGRTVILATTVLNPEAHPPHILPLAGVAEACEDEILDWPVKLYVDHGASFG